MTRLDELMHNYKECASNAQVQQLEQQIKDEYQKRTAALEEAQKKLREEMEEIKVKLGLKQQNGNGK